MAEESSKAYWGEERTVQRDLNITSGSFAAASDAADGHISHHGWNHCRDSFQGQMSANTTLILFAHEVGKGQRVAEFINIFEKHLEHEKISLFGPTNWNRVLWVKPAKFWMFKSIRRSLFTALLRAGQRYDPAKDNFEKALYGAKYIASTKEAVKWFLQGHTWCKTESNYGWNDFFQSMTADAVHKTLTRKPISQKALIQFALDLLGKDKEGLEAEFRRQKYGHQAVSDAEEFEAED